MECKAFVLDCNKSRYDTYQTLFYNYKTTFGHYPDEVKRFLKQNDCSILLLDYPRHDEEFSSLIEYLKQNKNKNPKKIIFIFEDNIQKDLIKSEMPDAKFVTYEQICKLVN